jgi:DnaJ-class molecular chaperone
MNPYTVLGVTPNSTDEEIRKSYRRLCLECHPDRNPGDPRAEDRFKEVSIAYTILSSSEKRHVYDMGGGDLGENIDQTIRTFVRGFGDFLDRFSDFDDEPEPPRKRAKPKAKAKKKKTKKKAAKKAACAKCNDLGYRVFRQGNAEFRTPCSCSR